MRGIAFFKSPAAGSQHLDQHYAKRLPVDEELNPRVVMAVGGWDSFAAIEPDLTERTETVVDEAFQQVGS